MFSKVDSFLNSLWLLELDISLRKLTIEILFKNRVACFFAHLVR